MNERYWKKLTIRSLEELNRYKVVFYIIIAIWAFLFYFKFFDQKILLGDEGVALNHPLRMIDGETPYKDFFMFIPPFSFILNALFLRIIGVSVLTSRLTAFILAVLLIWILDLILRKIEADFSLRLLSISILIPFGVSYWPMPSHHWWADLFCLLSIYFLLSSINNKNDGRFFKGERPEGHFRKTFLPCPLLKGGVKKFLPFQGRTKERFPQSFLSGIFAGSALWTLQDQGGYLLILITFFFLYKIIRQKEERRVWRANFLTFISGVVIFSIPFLLWLLPTAGFKRLYQDLVLFPLFSYHNLEGNRSTLLTGWSDIFGFFKNVNIFDAPFYGISFLIIAILFFVFPIISLISLIKGNMTKNGNKAELYLVFSLFVTFILTALHRWSFTNVVWALPGLIPSLKFFFEGKAKKISRIFAIFLTATFLIFSICFYNLSSNNRLVSICGKSGCIRSFKSQDAFATKEVVDYLIEKSKDGETLFTSGFRGMINFLTLLKNPTPFNDFVDYNTDEHFEMVKQSFLKNRVDWVVIPKPVTKASSKIEGLIKDSHNLVLENRFYKIYKIKQDV